MDRFLNIHVEWKKLRFEVKVKSCGTVTDLKDAIFKNTGLHPSQQQLTLDCKESLSEDFNLEDLHFKSDLIVVVSSLSEKYSESSEGATDAAINEKLAVLNIKDSPECSYVIKILNKPRDGKHLLVIDIDETIFDYKALTTSLSYRARRPFLHQFLRSVYNNYDIAFWSATSMGAIENKLHFLEINCNTHYKIVFYIDKEAMVVTGIPGSKTVRAKPLCVIWQRFVEYNRTNTIMIDNLEKNFLLNKKHGLCVASYSYKNYESDKELELLSKYLKYIAGSPDLSSFDHSKWKTYTSDN